MWNITQFLKASELRCTVWPSPKNSTESPLGLMSERGSFTSEIHLCSLSSLKKSSKIKNHRHRHHFNHGRLSGTTTVPP
jgi:hypothetical protein